MSRVPLLPDAARPLLFGHRGLSALAPENTIAAFRLALERGIPGVELDVHLTADGKLVVIHDHNTAALAPGQGSNDGLEIERTPLSRLRDLDMGAWKGEAWRGERMPLLDEVFEEFGDSLYYDIELKSRTLTKRGLEASVGAVLRDFGLAERCLVSSFNPITLRRFKALMPRTPAAIIWSNDAQVPLYLRHGEGRWITGRVDCLKPSTEAIGPCSSRRWARLGGYPVVAWTVDEPAETARLLALGCEGIISNCPHELGILTAGRAVQEIGSLLDGPNH